ncbi:MAG: hypothetical protein IPM66_18815 [Acidobacteriota bacterium]|nr:MAG: hypothetical protein IPM66_18815 [Acidobacteriota bacterium]
MKRFSLLIVTAILLAGLTAGVAVTATWTSSSNEGNPGIKSMGPLDFGPDGVLFIADTKAAAIVAISTGDVKPAAAGKSFKVEGVNRKIAALLGTTPDQIMIEDLAINPVSHNAYLSISRGRGPDATPVLVRVDTGGKAEVVSVDKVKYSRVELPDPPVDAMVGEGNRQSNPRRESITDIAYVDGRVFIAGLSNEEFSSTLRAIPYPFKTAVNGTNVEIYHGAHGRFETRAPVRTFAPFKIGKEDHLLAAYTCTPLVQFPVSALKPGAKIMGKTIAELGNRNRPLDMVVYQKDGKTYLLMANSSRGVMKIHASNIESADKIEAPVGGGGTKGLTFETIEGLTGVDQLARLDSSNVVVMRRGESGSLNLESMPLP